MHGESETQSVEWKSHTIIWHSAQRPSTYRSKPLFCHSSGVLCRKKNSQQVSLYGISSLSNSASHLKLHFAHFCTKIKNSFIIFSLFGTIFWSTRLWQSGHLSGLVLYNDPPAGKKYTSRNSEVQLGEEGIIGSNCGYSCVNSSWVCKETKLKQNLSTFRRLFASLWPRKENMIFNISLGNGNEDWTAVYI